MELADVDLASPGIVVKSEAGGPLRCDERVKAIHFNDWNSFAVEWIDGTVTTT